MTPIARHLLPAYMKWLAENRLNQTVSIMVQVTGVTARATKSGKQVPLGKPGEAVIQLNLSPLVAHELKINKDTPHLTFTSYVDDREVFVTVHLDALINIELPVTMHHSVFAPLTHGVSDEEIRQSLKTRKPNLEVVQ